MKEVLGNEVVAAVASNLAAKERIERASCLKLYWKSDMQSVTIMRGTVEVLNVITVLNVIKS